MRRRHPDLPTAWLLTDERQGERLWTALRRLPRGGGVIIRHQSLAPGERRHFIRRIRQLTAGRDITVLDEQREPIARVHNSAELRQALLRGPRLLFVSPLFATRTHPTWQQLPHLRAATLARLSRQPVLALGGMNARRFRQIKPLGFVGYGAIDGWLRT